MEYSVRCSSWSDRTHQLGRLWAISKRSYEWVQSEYSFTKLTFNGPKQKMLTVKGPKGESTIVQTRVFVRW
jgi:hypothetical protein